MSSEYVIEEWRDLWSFKSDYLFVCVAYIFSFNCLAYLQKDMEDYGGGTFILAYLISLLVVCLPLIMMELAAGQLTGRSPFQAIGRLCPLFKGVGFGFLVISLVMASVLAITIGYYGIYIVNLFLSIPRGELPWRSCAHEWNDCGRGLGSVHGGEMAGPFETFGKDQPVPNEYYGEDNSVLTVINSSYERQFAAPLPDDVLAATEFYRLHVQAISRDMAATGLIQWRPIAGAGAAWLLVFLAVYLGVRWLGKVCYFTVIIPIILLLGISVRALLLNNMAESITNLFHTDWDMFMDKQMWATAFSRSILAVGLCFGSYITLGSYSKRSNNMVADSCLLVFLHIVFVVAQLFISIGLTSLLLPDERAKLDFDPILGGLLVAAGRIPLGHLWCAALLFMVAIFMLNTMYVLVFTIVAALEDSFLGRFGSRVCPRIGVALGVCCLGFVLGLGYTVQAGPHAHKMIRDYFDIFPYWILLVFELFAIAWFYCAHLLGQDIRQMVSNACCWVWGIFLAYLLYVLPVVPVYILVMKLWRYTEQTPLDPQSMERHAWIEPVAWLCAVAPILPIPFFMVFVVARTCVKGPGITYWERFKYTLTSPMRYEIIKPTPAPRYTSSVAGGYVIIPDAPLAEPEMYNGSEYGQRVLKVSNI